MNSIALVELYDFELNTIYQFAILSKSLIVVQL